MAGQFCWVELLTKGADAAQGFYGHVLGWSFAAPGHIDRDYRVISAGEGASRQELGGVMELPAEAEAMGARPAWIGYIYSDDVDADVEKIVADGGKLFRPAETLPGIGRFAVVADPQGAPFTLFTDLSGKKPDLAPRVVGNVGWRELYANDVESAFTFYSKHFGWTKGEAFDMGPIGKYQLFATGAEPVGGMMPRPENLPQPFWAYYFTVPALDAALARVSEGGGHVVHPPAEVPGGMWIAQCFDPQGAFFALLADKR